jgi:nucleoid DNA-binding protein
MGKVMLQDLASVLVERWHLGKKEASMFVNDMFFVIQKSLDEDKIVKVKGLGTFKIIDVDDRESVDVNSGERVLIEGHGKITFTPDALMKELVNKPFSQFETVVLNEGVDFNEAIVNQPEETTSTVIDEMEDSAAPLVEFVDAPQSEIIEEPVKFVEAVEPKEPVEPEVPKEPTKSDHLETPEIQESAEPVELESKTSESVTGESPENEETASNETPEESEEPEVSDEFETVEEESAFKKYYKWIGIALLTLAVGVLIGYLMGNRSSNQPPAPQEPSVEIIDEETDKSLPEDSDGIKMATEVEKETLEDDAKVTEDDNKAVADDVEVKEKATALDKWETMDARVRTGAYRIIGTDYVEKARAGDNLTRICRRTIGPGMECYLEVYNGLSSGAALTAGQEIKIPKLELKKKRKK